MTDWIRVERTEEVEAWRGGWLGVWDSIVAWYHNGTRPTYTETLTFSVWVKDEGVAYTHGAQVESGQPDKQKESCND